MPDYSYGKIYKIWTENSDDVYIGSTVQTLSLRMTGHRRQYKRFLKTGKSYCSSYILLEQGNIHYELIEKYSCENKQELHKREGHWQKKIACVNDRIAGRTIKEWYQDNIKKISKKNKKDYQKNKEKILKKSKEYRQNNKEIISKYRENNKEKISKYHKEYHEKNKEKILKYHKEYKQKNKEKILKRQKELYQKNKNKLKEKHICICCGGKYTTQNWPKHSRTKKHVKAQKLQEQLQDLIPLYHQ